MSQWITNAPEDYDYNRVVKTLRVIGPMEGQRGTWREIEVLDEERFRAFQSPRYSSGWFVAYPADGTDAKKLGLRGLGGRLGSASADTLWSELRIGKSARAEFWRHELSQKLFDYELGGEFASELRPVLRDTDVTPEQLAAFETDESEHLAEEFKGVIAALDDQITNAQDWQIVAYGDAFYAAAPGGNKTSGLRGVSYQTRAETAAMARAASISSRRRGAPNITADSSDDELLAWLAWNDPNGEWSSVRRKKSGERRYADPESLDYDEELAEQEQSFLEDVNVPSTDELWETISEMLQ